MERTFGSTTASELPRGSALDLGGGARAWRSATSLLGHVLDGMVRFSEPYYADAARAGILLEWMSPERRIDAALEWHSRERRLV